MPLVEPRTAQAVGGAGESPSGARRRRSPRTELPAGRAVPSVRLALAPGVEIDLSEVARQQPLVICLFRAIGSGGPFPGETERLTSWQDRRAELSASGRRLIAISSESCLGQARSADVLTGWMVLSDIDLDLARRLPLALVSTGGSYAYEPATLIVDRGRIRKHFSAVDARDAERVTDWIRRRRTIRAVTGERDGAR